MSQFMQPQRQPAQQIGRARSYEQLEFDFVVPERESFEIEGQRLWTPAEHLGVDTSGSGGANLPPVVPIDERGTFLEFHYTGEHYDTGRNSGSWYSGRYPLYGAYLIHNQREINLTTGTPASPFPVFFTGTPGYNWANDPAIDGNRGDFNVIGLDIDEISRNPMALTALWHELGHVRVFSEGSDVAIAKAAQHVDASYLPEIMSDVNYAVEIGRHLNHLGRPIEGLTDLWRDYVSQSHELNRAYRLFHERQAWAYGYQIMKAIGAPKVFEHSSSFADYAKACLASYARAFSDNQFVDGIKPSQQ